MHIPFCVRKCAYCDFVSFPDPAPRAAYLSALRREIALAGERFPQGGYDTIFLGGGTPSLLAPEDLAALFTSLRGAFQIAPGAEITVECNPGTLSREKLAAYRAAGVNRLSLGLQSAEDALLRTIGRIHDFAAFAESFSLARSAGFTNINVDLMYGLPGQTQAHYLETLRRVGDLGPEHISAYCLILEEGTPLYARVTAGALSLPEEDAVCDMEAAGRRALKTLGYARYEISNYARPGFECLHNINYWRNGPYLGLGLAAHSAMEICGWRRWNNLAGLNAYLEALSKNRLPVEAQEKIGKREEMFECVMLGLRMLRGVDRAAFLARFGQDVCAAYPEAVEALCALGWAAVEPAALRLTEAGLDMENSALMYFLEDGILSS